jgi:hypothetical protein
MRALKPWLHCQGPTPHAGKLDNAVCEVAGRMKTEVIERREASHGKHDQGAIRIATTDATGQ